MILAHDGAAALKLALGRRADLVVLDVGLPQIDGYGVAREIRRQADIPVVALTGYAPKEATSLLFDAYLVKPVQPDELVRVLGAVRARASTVRPQKTEGVGFKPTDGLHHLRFSRPSTPSSKPLKTRGKPSHQGSLRRICAMTPVRLTPT